MLRAFAAGVVLLVLLPASAFAEWHFTPLVGYTFKGDTNIFDVEQGADKRHKNLGGAISLFGDGILGVEALVILTPDLFQQGDLEGVEQGRALSLMGNVVVTTPQRWTEYGLRPYVSGGVGLINARVTQIETAAGPVFPPVRLDAGGFNVGGGAIGFLTQRTGVRFDIRYHSTFRRTGEFISVDPDTSYLRYMTASVGIVFRRR